MHSSKFGSALRTAREEKALTLRAVEEKTNISRQTVLRAERGLYISLDIALRLFDALGIKPSTEERLLKQYLKEHVKKAKTKKRKRPAQREARPSA